MKVFRPNNKLTGFTLVEIMIVVLIIGILLAIAIPNFVAARESSRAKACVGNLKQIDSAKQQCAMDKKMSATSTDTFTISGVPADDAAVVHQLVGANFYIRAIPTCPSAGVYTNAPGTLGSVEVIGKNPTCSITGAAGSGYEAGAKWYHGLTN